MVLEAYVNGVSTRKVDRLIEQLGIAGMTKDRVSALCAGLDEQLQAFRNGSSTWLIGETCVEMLRDRAAKWAISS